MFIYNGIRTLQTRFFTNSLDADIQWLNTKY